MQCMLCFMQQWSLSPFLCFDKKHLYLVMSVGRLVCWLVFKIIWIFLKGYKPTKAVAHHQDDNSQRFTSNWEGSFLCFDKNHLYLVMSVGWSVNLKKILTFFKRLKSNQGGSWAVGTLVVFFWGCLIFMTHSVSNGLAELFPHSADDTLWAALLVWFWGCAIVTL